MRRSISLFYVADIQRGARILDIIVATQTTDEAKTKRPSGGKGTAEIVAFRDSALQMRETQLVRARVSISVSGEEDPIEFWTCWRCELGTSPASRRAVSLSAISLSSGTVSGK